MAIITLAEYKASIYYKSTQSDAQITNLIIWAEAKYLAIRNYPWSTMTVDTTNASAVLDTEETLVNSNTGQVFYNVGQRVSGSGITEGSYITAIDDDNSQVTISNVATATAEDVELTVYPLCATDTVARMISWRFNTAYLDSSLKSETIEKHSWTAKDTGDLVNGIPSDIASEIDCQYMRVT